MRKNENRSKEMLDLQYGNPGFLQEWWTSYYARKTAHGLSKGYLSQEEMSYKSSKAILPELEKQIRMLHKTHQNVKLGKNSQIIVGPGAVTLLSAAMYALKEKSGLAWVFNPPHITFPRPYWGRFKELAQAQNLQVTDDIKDKSMWSLVTIPNNPDGSMKEQVKKIDIADCCYNWPIYTEKHYKADAPITIFSLSKLSGFSATRIGWAIVRDEQLAIYMQNYIETHFSGTSIDGQKRAARVIACVNDNFLGDFFEENAKLLRKRVTRLKKIVEYGKLPIKIVSKRGMFWYIECRPQVVFDLRVRCFEGSNFGEPCEVLGKVDSGKLHRYRFNIGVESDVFEEFTKRLEYLGKLYK